MIKFALDEFGDFEGVEEKKGPVFIGGILYDEKDNHDYIEETKRIKAYYQKVIDELNSTGNFNLSYPESLHVKGKKSPGWKVGRVKEKVKATMGEFLRKGTYAGQNLTDEAGRELPVRKGEYRVFVVLKSDQGKPSLLKDEVTDAVRDNIASNLYFHIARDTIRRVLFHNPVLTNPKELSLDIATRCSRDISEMTNGERKKYEDLHYKTVNIKNEDKPIELFSLTNADVYRTILAEELESIKNHPKTQFYVWSIKYEPDSKYQEFLYLADSICSLLSFELPGSNADQWLTEIIQRLNGICDQKNQCLFAYDSVDTDLTRIYTRIEEKDFFGALSELFDAKQRTGAFADYYKKRWYPFLEKSLAERIGNDTEAMEDAIIRLGRATKQSNINQRKLIYIYEGLVNAAEQLKKKNVKIRNDSLYVLYDSGISAYCHMGQSSKAEECLQKCFDVMGGVDISVLIRTTTKHITNLCDMFRYEEAMQLAEKLKEMCDLSNEIKGELTKLVTGKECEVHNNTELAKAYSLAGQAKAFLRRDDAETEFLNALERFEKDSTNYRITQSYLLHFYLDNKKEEEYRKASSGFFGGAETIDDRLSYVENNGLGPESIITFKYAMYVLIRQIYTFDLDRFKKVYFERFLNYHKAMTKKTDKYFLEHPVEIINKYLELIAIAKNQPTVLQSLKEYDDVICNDPGVIIKLLTMFGKAQVAQAEGNIEERNSMLLQLDKKVKALYPYMRDRIKGDNPDALFESYGELFTFMYC